MDWYLIAAIVAIVAGLLTIGSHLYRPICNVCSSISHKIKQAIDEKRQRISSANQAVTDALEAWDNAENYREKTTEYVEAHGGNFPTRQVEIEFWEIALSRCERAALSLELGGDIRSAKKWVNNSEIASGKVEGLKLLLYEDTSKRYIAGIDEAKQRAYYEKRAKDRES